MADFPATLTRDRDVLVVWGDSMYCLQVNALQQSYESGAAFRLLSAAEMAAAGLAGETTHRIRLLLAPLPSPLLFTAFHCLSVNLHCLPAAYHCQ